MALLTYSLTQVSLSLFVDKERLTAEALLQLQQQQQTADGVSIYPYSDICDKITALLNNDGKIWVSVFVSVPCWGVSVFVSVPCWGVSVFVSVPCWGVSVFVRGVSVFVRGVSMFVSVPCWGQCVC